MNQLRAQSVSKRFRGVEALSNVTLSLSPGELVGLVGPNGAGKSTLFELMSGFQTPTEGTLQLDGRDITKWSPEQRARHGVVRTFQIVQPFAGLSVTESILVAAYRGRTRKEAEEITSQTLEKFGFGRLAKEQTSHLTLAQQRLLEMARAAVLNPKYLLLDEPMSGLGIADRRRCMETVQSLSGSGAGVLLVEHDMGLISAFCQTVHVLDQGQLIASGTPDQIRRSPEVRRVYLGAGLLDSKEGAG